LRAKTLTAQEAKEVGLVSTVIQPDRLEETVQNLVADIKEQSPTAIRLGLKAFQEMKSKNADDKHKYLHAMLMQCLQSKDAAEGLAAFKEKRKAVWIGE
jgi:enoyl-CoA hydratase/carnithine racemase